MRNKGKIFKSVAFEFLGTQSHSPSRHFLTPNAGDASPEAFLAMRAKFVAMFLEDVLQLLRQL